MNYIVRLLVRASYREDIPFGKFVFSDQLDAGKFYEKLCDGIFNTGSAVDGYIAVTLTKEIKKEEVLRSKII